MVPLGLAELSARAEAFDAAVAQTPEIDHFCSSSAWILSAAETLMPPRREAILTGEHGTFAVMRAVHESGAPYLEPLELSWGLACPLIGREVEALVDEVAAELGGRSDWAFAVVPGVTATGRQARALTRPGRPWEVRSGTPTVRHVASLEGGVEGFLRRRTPNFRKALHKSLRAATAAGIEVVAAADGQRHDVEAAALYARIMAVEAGSWKSLAGVGISAGPMRSFYEHMLPRLLARGRARVMFARAGEQDIGYILGAVFEGEYRGLQFSYRDDYAAYSVGSLCQYHQILALCEEGVRAYDLGTEMEYKSRWAERQFVTELLLLVRTSG